MLELAAGPQLSWTKNSRQYLYCQPEQPIHMLGFKDISAPRGNYCSHTKRDVATSRGRTRHVRPQPLHEPERHVFARMWSRRWIWIAAGAGVIALLSGAILFRTHQAVVLAQVPFSDLLRDLDQGVVAEVVVTGDT